jgi:hypothetical protein
MSPEDIRNIDQESTTSYCYEILRFIIILVTIALTITYAIFQQNQREDN